MKVLLLAGQSNMQGFGKIAGYPVLRDDRIFNQTKEAIASLKNAAFASSEGLICDGAHFNTESIRFFGVRYAKAYLDIAKFALGVRQFIAAFNCGIYSAPEER